MIGKFKRFLYFPIASYFRFFASIRLKRWNPKILVVTGSNGKTTLLHMLESQIGDKARYSHHANSSFGIPFDILDLHRTSLLKSEWISLILKTPFSAFKKPPKERLYVVEVDCDRPGEGKFLAELLKPEIVLWVSTSKTHSMYFEQLVAPRHPRANGDPYIDSRFRGNDNKEINKFNTVEEAIAYEFGYFLEYATDSVVIDGDSDLMKQQLNRTKTEIISVKKDSLLKSYQVSNEGTRFEIENQETRYSSSEQSESRSLKDKSSRPNFAKASMGKQAQTINNYKFKYLLPEEVFYSIEMCRKACELLNISFDQSFSNFQMPPGRGSIFKGIKDITIVDSSYNLSPGSLKAVLETFSKYSAKSKWVIIGDMLQLGKDEKEEHRKLAEYLASYDFDRIILMGPRVSKYTYPKLLSLRAIAKQSHKDRHAFQARDDREGDVVKFLGPKETLEYILRSIQGGETILFKGARFMEGIIEQLLENKDDVKKLSRREKIWEIRRKQWGL